MRICQMMSLENMREMANVKVCATKFIFDQRQQKLLNYKQYCVRGEERLCTVAFTFFSPTQHEAECMDGEEMQKSYHNTHTAEAKVIRWFKP